MNGFKKSVIAGAAAIGAASSVGATDLSPAKWPIEIREAAEKAESQGMTATQSRVHVGTNGAISGTASAISVAAGLMTLQNGGNAADAATAIAMTGITTQMGSVVSYAGIMSMVYYEAATGKVHALDGGYNGYREETDPLTIPVADLGMLQAAARTGTAGGGNVAEVPETQTDLGRETLVGGYMAGMEAMQKRFGKLKWADLFAPAIHYAENGVTLSPSTSGFFAWRKTFLERTPEGKAFLAAGGTADFKPGETFAQPEAAKTLRAVAAQGAAYMYTGPWADEYVRIVRREGGKVVKADLAEYRPTWAEPLSTSFAGTTVYSPGGESDAGYNVIPLLNLAEASGLDKAAPFWRDPQSFIGVSRITGTLENAPHLREDVRAALTAKGIDHSPASLLTKDFARQVAPLLPTIGVAPQGDAQSRHSNSLVVVDKEGNVAAITHTINSVVWGSTGIVVGGIPIPDSGGFQQQALAKLKPGGRLPNPMVQAIALKDGEPVLATAGIGSGLIPENFKILLSMLGQKLPLAEVQAAPPLLSGFALRQQIPEPAINDVAVPAGAYDEAFLAQLKAGGLAVHEISQVMAGGLRGTVATITFDPNGKSWQSTETPGVLLFGATY
ncbi:gamma-glutamyltransferase [Sphingosinicella rhizophila]|uniref:Gamma-glutamyltransferase n=1 Tax=Sphingosinicella rhizophila TaxID=3050082 RepID=A0ABU3QCG1_9SPHN|nr:gamma-glutamyltransferase [Sphingosinicella sp. GR2756]MDT9601017.1 gamma-glutamyltransferase [Sphingosinicella sp. GR2756]